MHSEDPVPVGGTVRHVSTAASPRVTVCTLVTRWDEYQVMRASFLANGFDEGTAEYLVADNSTGNNIDAFAAINLFLLRARASLVLICHQDVELIDDGFADLEARVAEIETLDPNWGVLGNAGSSSAGKRVMRITDPHGTNQRPQGLPIQVDALDENFLLVRREANLAVSRDLGGFHHYGHDLCIVADVLGWSCYVVDFHLLHKSRGSIDRSFDVSRSAMIAKYARAFRARTIAGTTQRAYQIGGSAPQRWLGRLMLVVGRGWRRLARRFALPHTPRDALDAPPGRW